VAPVDDREIVPEHPPLRGKILVAEDNKANQLFMELTLKKLGLSAEIAADGVEAVEKFRRNRYDLILMDENMPRLNGIAATRQIRQIEKEEGRTPTPIVSLTANALKEDRERFIEAGMNDYLAKPLDPDALVTTLRDLLPAE
jgi:CheY-like chemotaxis protein